MPALSKTALHILLGAGLLLMAHSVFEAMKIKDNLQAHHHASEADDDGLRSSGTVEGHSLPLWIAIEAVLGMLLAIVGHIGDCNFAVILRRELAPKYRYDRVCGIDADSIHFNHRGSRLNAQRRSKE